MLWTIQIHFEDGPYMVWMRIPDSESTPVLNTGLENGKTWSLFLYNFRIPISFSPYHFWFGEFKVQNSPCLFLEGEEESMLSGDQLHLTPCLPKWKVYAIHNFRAQVMKLQGAIFLPLAINIFQPAFSSELHLAFPQFTRRSSFCFLPDFPLLWMYEPVLWFMYLFSIAI